MIEKDKMKGAGAMDRKGPGIKIYREARRGRSGRQERLSGMFLFFSAVFCLGAAWWNAFLSVFSPALDSGWLYGGLAVVTFGLTFLICRAGGWTVFPVFLALGIFIWRNRESVEALFFQRISPNAGLAGVTAAVLTIPALALWIFVIRSGKGKMAAGAAAAAPFIAAACAGFFPSFRDSWLLLFAGVMYYVSGVLGKMSVLKSSVSLILASGSFTLLAGISVFAGGYLDTGREVEGSFYQLTRETLRTDLVGGIERLVYETERDEGENRTDDTDNTQVLGQNDPEEDAPAVQEEQQGNAFGVEPMTSDSGMENLKEIGSFVPDARVNSSVILQDKPVRTVYVPYRIGVQYTGSAWEAGDAMLLGEPGEGQQHENRIYTSYPSGLDRLVELCREWDVSSLVAVGRQIDEALASMAVYDTNPGTTPADWDFAEYFLFENHKGFCVHFATSAALLYRMCGYPAVYAEGYAVPPSAFVLQEDGSYRAEIDGSMGHAWCQVYDETEGSWIDVEHTPAASGAAAEDVREQETPENAKEDADGREGVCAQRIFLAAGVVLLLSAGLIMVQAAVRRKRLRSRMSYSEDGAGILAMYDLVLRTAKFMGEVPSDDLSADTLKILKKISPNIKEEYWNQFYEQVTRSLFYFPETGEKEWENAWRLCQRFSESALRRMGRGKRLACRCIYCLDPFSA